MNYRTTPPVVIIPGVSMYDSHRSLQNARPRQGELIAVQTGEAAEVGTHGETWWAMRGDPWAIDVQGNVTADLRQQVFNVSTPGLKLVRLLDDTLVIDWSGVHDLMRQHGGGMLRVDVVLKDLGAPDNGLLRGLNASSARHFQQISDLLCSAQALAHVCRFNDSHFGSEYVPEMETRLIDRFLAYLQGRADRAVMPEREHARQASVIQRAEDGARRWREAIEGAARILSGESVQVPASMPEPTQDVPAPAAEQISATPNESKGRRRK